MSLTHALKKICPVLAATLLLAGAAHGAPPTPLAGTPPAAYSFSITPASPVVIDASIIFSDGTSVQGPWFKFTPSMINNTGRIITVVSMQIEAVTTDHGVSTTQIMDIAPNQWNGIFQSRPNQPIAPEEYDIGPLERSDSHVYQITLHMSGWYGTLNLPEDRFHLDYSFHTR